MNFIKTSLLASLFAAPAVMADEAVTLDNYIRAESDTMLRATLNLTGGVGKLIHMRVPTPLNQQPVIRMNRDTLYSAVIVDLNQPATMTIPDAKGRYLSMHVVNQDHYSYAETIPGVYKLTKETVGSRYASVSFRTLVNANDPEDIKKANRIQDAIGVNALITDELALPQWSKDDLLEARGALNTLAKLGLNSTYAFGQQEEVKPLHHLIGTAAGWGGLPVKNAYYELSQVENNTSDAHSLTVKDVPVNAFWSVTVYNADGYISENKLGHYSFNNLTSEKNSDGSITINFGSCDDGRINCLPISDGWNYAVRLYEPRTEIIDGEWTFPVPMPVKLKT